PINNTQVFTNKPTIQGTSSDSGSGVQKVEVSIDSGAYTMSTGTTSWSYTSSTLSAASHTVTARSTDNSGMTATTLPVTFTVTVLDTTAPSISITSPTSGAIIPAGNVAITGTASDIGSGVNSIQLMVNGTSQVIATPKAPGDWSNWNASLIFSQPGSNTLSIKATDNLNNSKLYLVPIAIPDKTARLSSSPSPTMFWFIVRTGFPDMTNLIQLYQKHAKPSYMITQFTNSLLDSSVTTSISSMKSVTYFSLLDIQNNAKTLHTNGYNWIVYDLEPSLSPVNEVSDPVNSVLQASQIAHSNGLGLAITQAQIPQSYFQGMATYSDAFVLQVQDRINGDPTIFVTGIKYNINLIRTANPNEIVILQGSTIKNTPSQINAAYDMTYKMIDGLTVFYNMTSIDVPKMAKVFTHVDGIS
ncbi:MAG TPA: Ig-like domain-containing protein, partial [Nitrosopumilaceae archaeon]|nr:Ig-like domain-containing protein [Nitrosopumilaceae archaeon]